MNKLCLTFIFLSCHFLSLAQVQKSRTVALMGSLFQITLAGKDSVTVEENIDKVIAEIDRIENLISEWMPHTQISEVNQNAGIKPVKVDTEVFELTKRAIYFSKITKGAFDISIVAMDKIWVYDGTMEKMPSKKSIKTSVKKVNYKHIVLDPKNSTIFLKKKGMKIGFGSIGKGYAADKSRELIQSLEITGGIVNASGDIATWGKQADGTPWRIGVNNPFEMNEMVEILEFTANNAVATSGSYSKFIELNDTRFSHIINPKTGYPSTGITSVTIIGAGVEMCNGFSTSVMVLGLKKGMKLLNKHPQFSYIIIADNGEIHSSKK